MPGRSWVAGIDIAKKLSLYDCGLTQAEGGQATSSAATRAKALFYTELRRKRNLPAGELIEDEPITSFPIGLAGPLQQD